MGGMLLLPLSLSFLSHAIEHTRISCYTTKISRFHIRCFSSAMPTIIRPVQKDDEPAWSNLWSQYNAFYKRTIPEEVTKTTFARFLDDKVRMYGAVAVDGDKITGFVNWYPHPSTSSVEEIVYLHDLFVDPSVRNKGTGRLLIEHVYEHAKTIPAGSVYWHTQYFNHAAQLLYVKVAERSDFVHYSKTL